MCRHCSLNFTCWFTPTVKGVIYVIASRHSGVTIFKGLILCMVVALIRREGVTTAKGPVQVDLRMMSRIGEWQNGNVVVVRRDHTLLKADDHLEPAPR
jgi:hypothetical protein